MKDRFLRENTSITLFQLAEHQLAPVWPAPRHYSNSPEPLDIPNIVLTEADGLAGRVDCYDHAGDMAGQVGTGLILVTAEFL